MKLTAISYMTSHFSGYAMCQCKSRSVISMIMTIFSCIVCMMSGFSIMVGALVLVYGENLSDYRGTHLHILQVGEVQRISL